MPRCDLRWVAVGNIAAKNLLRVGEAGLVDQVPREPGHILESLHNRPDISLFRIHGARVGVGVRRNRGRILSHRPRVRREREEGEVHGDLMPPRAVEKGFEIAQEPLVRAARCRFNEMVVRHPHAGAHKAHAMRRHLSKILVPYPSIPRPREVPAVLLGGEIVGAHREKWLAVQRKKVAFDAENRPRGQRIALRHQESVLIKRASVAVLAVDGGNFVESRRQRLMEGRVQSLASYPGHRQCRRCD